MVTSRHQFLTDELLATHRLSQVEVSEAIVGTLVSSSASVGETQQEFHLMASYFAQCKKFLSKYHRREVTDKVLVSFLLAFFLACSAKGFFKGNLL